MSFAAVTWAYRDVLTSAKLAQMVENVRTHDHAQTDQGGRLGFLAGQAAGNVAQAIPGVGQTAIAGSAYSFTITPNDGARFLVAYRSIKVNTALAVVDVRLTEWLSNGTQLFGEVEDLAVTGTGYQTLNGLFFGLKPAPGTYTSACRVQFGTASGGNAVAWLDRAAMFLL